MQTCTGAICGLRRGVAEGFRPTSMVISLTIGILLGGPDAAASAGRFVSLAPDAFESENLLMARQPRSVEGMDGDSPRYDTLESQMRLRMRLRIIYTFTCAMKALTRSLESALLPPALTRSAKALRHPRQYPP